MGQVHEGCVWPSLSPFNVAHVRFLSSVENIAEMTAIGLGLPRDTIKEAGKYGQVHIHPLHDHTLTRFAQSSSTRSNGL